MLSCQDGRTSYHSQRPSAEHESRMLSTELEGQVPSMKIKYRARRPSANLEGWVLSKNVECRAGRLSVKQKGWMLSWKEIPRPMFDDFLKADLFSPVILRSYYKCLFSMIQMQDHGYNKARVIHGKSRRYHWRAIERVAQQGGRERERVKWRAYLYCLLSASCHCFLIWVLRLILQINR